MAGNAEGRVPQPERSVSRAIRFASLALVVVTITALGAAAYFTERGILGSRDRVIHTYQVRSELSDLQSQLLQAKASELAYLLTQSKDQSPQSGQLGALARQTLGGVRNLTRDNPRQEQRLNQLWPLLDQELILMNGRPNSSDGVPHISLREIDRQEQIDNLENQIDSIIASMQDEEQRLLDQRLKAWDYLFKRNMLMLGMAFAVVTIMLAYNFWLLIKEVSQTKDREERVRANAESYRLMSARILELQDSERRRIARELHDSVGQFLAGLKINLSQLDTSRAKDAALVNETIGLTDCAIQEVRTISHLLHPPLLEELGFLSAARWYVDEYGKRSQVKVSLMIDEPIERLPKEVEIALFRVLQETLTNVYRHAAARSVTIQITCRNGVVQMTVADDGKGIPEDVLVRFRGGAASGIGLAGMRERLAEFGGRINVQASAAGSVVEATIPTTVS